MEMAGEGAKGSFQSVIKTSVILYTNDYSILRTEGTNYPRPSVVIPQQLRDTDKCDYVTGKVSPLAQNPHFAARGRRVNPVTLRPDFFSSFSRKIFILLRL